MKVDEAELAEKAFALFAHYGVKKTTMTEVAAAAGVARQTLYNAFDSKEALIFAAMTLFADKSRAAIQDECSGLTQIGARMDVVFRHYAVEPFRAIRQMPHADEIFEVANTLPQDKQALMTQHYVGTVTQALLPFQQDLTAAGLDLPELAAFIRASFSQLKKSATSEEELYAQYRPLRALVCRAVEAPVQAQPSA